MMTMTHELAMAAAKDAANLRMRKAGRTTWNRADYNHCVRTFNKLFPYHVTPSQPEPVTALMKRREADVRKGRVVKVMHG